MSWLLVLAGLSAGWAAEPPIRPGTYLMDVTTITLADVSLGTHCTIARTLLIAELSQTPEGWVQEHRVCDTWVRERPAVFHTEVSTAYLRGLPVVRYPVTFQATPEGWQYAAHTAVERVGWQGVGDVPERADDPRVVDSDKDGQPGATVSVRIMGFPAAEIYIAQRSRTQLDGRVSQGGVSGTALQSMVEQRTLGASVSAFQQDREGPVLSSEREGSAFTLAPLPAGTTCAGVPYPEAWPAKARHGGG